MERLSTTPPGAEAAADVREPLTGASLLRSRGLRRVVLAAAGLGVLVAGVVWLTGDADSGLTRDGQVTIIVFVVAVWAWVFTSVDDTYVALGATVSLVLLGVLSTQGMFEALGDDTVWLLLAAFVIASGVTSSGLAMRATAYVASAARTPGSCSTS